jgi:2-keto-4-pentenoate hydratase/2-oxohepta-3-ene-1,7-dioic acid hydratase in catechol pathway
MFVKYSRYVVFAGLLLSALTFLAWLSSPDPKFNKASFESKALTQSIADPDRALTLAQYRAGEGEVVTLLVDAVHEGKISGIDLADLGARREEDPFAALASIDADQLTAAFSGHFERHVVAIEQLLPTAPPGGRHLGIGTNFPEHAEEAHSESVFVFPKFGAATPARTMVAAPEGGLLDYEVELCMRFDRPIRSLEDFDAAVKGLFLCADFTDRIALLELADPDNLDSGYGFSDAKSGLGFFPTGPFLVIPKDWSSFVADTRMMTWLNGEARQDARGGEMTLDFRELAEKVLGDMTARRFYYAGDFYKLAPNQHISQDMALMSGTSEGVIFTTPARHDYIEIALAYLLEGGPLSGKGLMDIAIPVFIESERASGHFLQPGDTVVYRASMLGDIVVEITP